MTARPLDRVSRDGSAPGRGLGKSALLGALAALVVLGGCGDECEQLCQNVGARIDDCGFEALSWNDLGARNRADFVNQCQQQWDRERIDLSASDLRLSLDACRETNDEIDTYGCAAFLALYGNQD